MIRCFLMLGCLAVSLMSIGCCAPMAGPGCGPMGCHDCDGLAGNVVPQSPLDGLRQLKRSIVCGGGGCGETYIGEWISTPPDAVDPCCNNQWVGGAQKCRPFCFERGALLRGLYGSRFCSDEESTASCGCGGACDGSCGAGFIDGGYIDGGYLEGGYIDHGVINAGSTAAPGGCATCSMNRSPLGSRVSQAPRVDSRTRTASRTSREMQQIRR